MLTFAGPAVMNVLFMLMLFAVVYGAGQRGGTDGEQATLRICFQISYLLASLLLGPRLNAHNARRVLVVASAGGGLLGALCLQLTDLHQLMAVLLAIGVCSALYFNGFQAFMRGAGSANHRLSVTVGGYTLGWSSGCVVGTLAGGVAYAAGKLALGGLCLVCAAISLLLLHFQTTRSAPPPPAPAAATPPPPDWHPAPGPERAMPGYVLVGWLLIVSAVAVQHPQQALIPGAWAKLEISPWWTSLPLFLQFLLQALLGLGLGWVPACLYRRSVLLTANLLAVALLLWMSVQTSKVAVGIGLAALGLWLAYAYFASVYYVNDSPRRAFNVGVNECLVGVGSVLCTGLIGHWFGPSLHAGLMFRVQALLLLGFTVAQVLVATIAARRHARARAAVA